MKIRLRLADGGIKCQLHRFQAQDRQAKSAKAQPAPESRGISEDSLKKAEEKLKLL
jgi:hypothetical protein